MDTDNRITEYRVRMLKFNDNYCDKTRAVYENEETSTKKSSAQVKNSVKVNEKQPEISRDHRTIAGQISHRTEKRRRSDNQVEKKRVMQIPVSRNRPFNHYKPRKTESHFTTKRKIFISAGVEVIGLGPKNNW